MSNIKDVARVAGVSITTVSRVLNNTNYISAETKKKVYDAIHELDYHPHQIARALSKKQSFIIGLILPDSSHPFFAQLGKAIEKTAELSEYKVLLCNSLNDKGKEAKYIKMLRENRADGIIMGSHALNTKEYEKIQYPVVTFDRTIGENPCISSDNFQGGQLATQHLIERGCKNLLHISGPLKLDMLSNRRAEAFRFTCMEKKVNYQVVEYQHTKLTFDYYMEFLEKNEKLIREHDGIFCSNDILAYAVYVYATRIGLKVPKDLKIVGYDYCQFAQTLQTPKLTTIAQPIDLMGRILCSSLIDLIEKREVYSQLLAVRLIEGETT